MKEQAAAIEYVHLAREFQELVDGRIDKIYADGDYLLFTIYTGERRLHLVLDVPHVAYLTQNKPSFDRASGFTMYLRKKLQGARIRTLEQLGLDRIFRLELETKDTEYHVYIELFGKGNFVICDTNDEIISAMDATVYADRSFKKGEQYQPPPPQPDLREISHEEFSALFGEREAVKVLASGLGLGGEYAEIVCKRAGVDKNAESPDLKSLHVEVKRLIEESAPEHTEDAAYPVHVMEDAVRTDTFSQAIAAIRDPLRAREKRKEKKGRVDKAKDKVASIAHSQEQQIKGFSKSIEENQRKGELIYEHYQEVVKLLDEARKDRKSLSPEAFREKWEQHPLVAEADPQKFVVELD